MKSILFLTKVLILTLLLAVSLCPLVALAASPPQPTYVSAGSTVVNGAKDEWSDTDYFADMYRAFDPTKTVEAKVYLRYDCTNDIMFVLVYQNGNIPILANGTYNSFAWASINGIGNKVYTGNSGNNGTPPDFAWVGLNYDGNPNHARGYEASFYLPAGTYKLIVHVEVFDSGGDQTAGTSRAASNQGIDLVVVCQHDAHVSVVKYISTDQINWQHADTSPGLTMTVGTNYYIKFVVTNTGIYPLTNVEVNDNVYGSIGSWSSLASGVSQEVVKGPYTAELDQHSNLATVYAKYNTTDLTDNDRVYYTGVTSMPAPVVPLMTSWGIALTTLALAVLIPVCLRKRRA